MARPKQVTSTQLLAAADIEGGCRLFVRRREEAGSPSSARCPLGSSLGSV